MRLSKVLVPLLLATLLALSVLAVGCGPGKPRISSVQPASGAPGSEAVIVGRGFGDAQKDGNVRFGDQETEIRNWADEEITAMVPRDIKEGEYEFSVTTDAGTSNTVTFTVKGADASQAGNSGEIEHVSPVQAVVAWMTKNNIDTTGLTYVVLSVSRSDPTWKIDEALKGTQEVDEFLLHQVRGDWTVVDDSERFSSEELASLGAPADLQAPTNPPAPQNEQQVILGWLQANGQPTDGWTFTVAKVSGMDQSWEIVQGARGPAQRNFLMVYDNMASAWQVLAADGPPWPPGTNFKGEPVPADLNSL